jgi:hypothetical protein
LHDPLYRRLPSKTQVQKIVALANNKFRQLRDIDGDPPRLILAEQLGGRAAAGLILEIDIGKLLPDVVSDNKAGVLFLNRLRRREAAAVSCTAILRAGHTPNDSLSVSHLCKSLQIGLIPAQPECGAAVA